MIILAQENLKSKCTINEHKSMEIIIKITEESYNSSSKRIYVCVWHKINE